MSAVFDLALHSRRPNRAFNYAVLASLAFHGALLFAFVLRPKAPPAQPGLIVAHLAPRTPAVVPAPAQPEPPKPRVEEPAPPPPPPQVKPTPHPKPSPLAKAESKAARPAPVTPAEPAPPQPQPAAPAPSAPVAPSAPAPVAKAEPSPAPVADSGSLETYRVELMRMARNYKRYPRTAMDNNWEGRVVVRMIIGANGMIASISVISSSGHEILDKQAVDMIQKAKPRVLIPAALRGKEFPLEIPVIYSLREPDSG
ncbi:MAG: TonB family protein [Clostridia bacterium]